VAAENPLETLIRETIAREGPLPFARFMALALYHPTLGYYAGGGQGREPIGWSGDYFTSGDVHPLWGWCIARQLHAMWTLLGRPAIFSVVEPGAGRGLLARDVWAYALEHAPDWASALRYTLVDRALAGSPLRARREAALAAALAALSAPPGAVRWAGALEDAAPPGSVGCVVANELVDALPVHIVEVRNGALQEIYVDAAPGRLVERLGPLSHPDLAGYLDHYRIPWRTYGAGWRAEICLEAASWMRAAARVHARGFVLILDYGDTARRLYTRDRRRGTLTAYTRHQLGERPLANPGQQDLTAHVNFSALRGAGRAAGLRTAGFTTQRDLLQRLGIQAEVEARAARLYPFADSERHTDRGQTDYLRRASLRNAVAALLHPQGLGGFKALLQHRGVPGARPGLHPTGPPRVTTSTHGRTIEEAAPQRDTQGGQSDG
jgi:SAM-dependent MidA family methyltransferase